MNTIILQITSGRGPAECCWVVAQILRFMMGEAKKRGLTYELLQKEKGPERETLHSATLQLKGKGVDPFTKEWIGSILWVGRSPYRPYHKRKNWFVAVNELKLIQEKINIPDQDIAYQAIRSGGPGGQHVNKVSTAIRATHIPSKLNVLASDSRSQLQNKKLAKERLTQLLQLDRLQEKEQKEKDDWQNHNSLQRGNPVKVFEGGGFRLKRKH